MSEYTSRQDKTAILGEISPIFHLFSAFGTLSTIFLPTCLQNLPISVYFRLFSAYFPLKIVPHPCYKFKHGTHLLCFSPHVYGFCIFSAYILLIFHLYSAHFPPNFLPIFRRSCLAGFTDFLINHI